MFQFVDSSFRPEVQALVDRGEVTTLEELNAALRSWLDGYYHAREHGSTKQSPKTRFETSGKPRKRLPLVDLNEMFLWEEERTANKTGCIQLAGNTYEVDSDLAGKRLAVRYDPFDLSEVQVWYAEKRYADAVPMDLRKKRKTVQDLVVPQTEPGSEALSFLDLAEKKRQAAWSAEEMRYAREQGGERQ